MEPDVAVLYVDPRGPYPRMPGVDCWDAARDARRYAGPWPVVAHPPCGPWGRLRHLSRKDDPALALRAVEQVRAFGGVLEHPAGSLLIDHCRLPRPGAPPDEHGGRTIEVCQVDWGHVARKRTWLYLVRVTAPLVLPAPREPTHWISGGRGRAPGRMHTPVPPGIKVCSAQQRRRTPPLFAAWLVALARSVRAPSLEVTPITLREAMAFVAAHHRHHAPPPGGLFAIGCSAAGRIAGVAIVGRPVARALADDFTAEVTRVCTDGTRNACSLLYSAAWRAARAMGYRRLVTYTIASEPGGSLRGAGWTCLGEAGGGTWSRRSRPRVDTHPTQTKLRWERTAATHGGRTGGQDSDANDGNPYEQG